MTHRRRLGQAGYYIISILLAVLALIPFLWMISTSLKSRGALMSIPIEWIPAEPTLDAYTEVFSRFPFLRTIGNSLFISVAFTLITLVSASMAAFAFAKLRFRGSGVILSIYIATMMIPTQVTMIPLFVVMNRLGLIDSYASVILPSMFKPFAVFLLVQQMKTIPNDYLDAARIDGAGLFHIYFRVALPLCIPTLATLAVTTFMESWNDYLWPLLMLTDRNKMTLPIALSTLNGQYNTEYNVLMAGSLISMIPIIIIYIAAQKQFKAGLMAGGIKG
ncbi:MAG TPA: carbohydrate ABC transporter permease [Candidatus Scatomorpha intestinigallinarum]|jgi:ABC transporter, permease protein|uniref:Carbohydrate ABC transporter permease n=1 Tax=Candidatus Scatomorpha intestinigallinarum TaxID=2840923 RepID=A0A9D1IZR2_9FIRM|nr:carbohydrate ABC transporter permease [Candidatus Scatomorpha intestinigallinarum]